MYDDLSRISERLGLKKIIWTKVKTCQIPIVATPMKVRHSILEVVDDYVCLGKTVKIGRSNFEKEICSGHNQLSAQKRVTSDIFRETKN